MNFQDLENLALSLNAFSELKKTGSLNYNNAKVLSSILYNSSEKSDLINKIQIITQAFKSSAFELPDESVKGPIKLAETENNLLSGFFPHEYGWLLSGMPSSGKTTLMFLIAAQVLNSQQPILVWCFGRAEDLRPLLLINQDIIIEKCDGQATKHNFLECPSNIEKVSWSNVLSNIFTQTLDQTFASEGYLRKYINLLYSKFEQSEYNPSLIDLYQQIKKSISPPYSRDSRYKEGVLNRLEGSFINTSLSSFFDCSKGHTKNLINHNAIFEIQMLTSHQSRLLINYFLSFLFFYKLHNKCNYHHFVFIDDCTNIFDINLEKKPDAGLPIIHSLLTTMRKANINIFAATQTPSEVGSSIHGNSFGKIMFSLTDGKDIERLRSSMGIKDPEQIAKCYQLDKQEVVIKFSSRYQEPFLAKVPKIKNDSH